MFQLLIALTLMASMMTPAAAQDEAITVGTEGDYPPFSFSSSDGTLMGWDIDLVSAVCEEVKLECTFVRQSFDGMIPALLTGKIDAISSINITEERKEAISFTNKHYNIPYRWVVAKNSGLEPTKAGLRGKIVGLQSGTIQERYVTDNFGEDVTIRLYQNQDDANRDLISGRIDATLAQELVITESFLDTPEGVDFMAVGEPVTDPRWFGEGTAIGVRKADDELRIKLNEGLAAILADGTYEKLNSKYFPIDIFGER